VSAPTDPPITLTLSLSTWGVVWQHIGRGTYMDVAAIMAEMAAQACPQIEAANRTLLDEAAATRSNRPKQTIPTLPRF
jgi:hypothetical protein